MEEEFKSGFGYVREENFKGWFGRVRDIVKRSKPLSELVVEEKFLVEKVVCNNEIVDIYVDLNRYNEYGSMINVDKIRGTDGSINEVIDDMFGDFSKGFNTKGGIKPECFLMVKPFDKNCPIHTLKFSGYTPIIGGNIISAKIARYKEHEFRNFVRKYRRKHNMRPEVMTLYNDRPYESVEVALELTMFDNDRVVRKDRSPEYKLYFT
jgi:hypothetical protein